MQQLIENRYALLYMLAGKSEVAMKSVNTGKTLSFKITKKESNKQNSSEYIYFINYIAGDRSVYAGVMAYKEDTDTFEFYKGAKGNMDKDCIEIKGLLSVVNKLHKERYDLPVEIYHCGRCGKCGKRLTVPESVLTGLGPECAKKCGVPHPKNKMYTIPR